jgi:hypothetical protein
MSLTEYKKNQGIKVESQNLDQSDVETGLLELKPKNEQPDEIKRLDTKAAYKDLPNILILIGLYFLQGMK